MTSPASAHPFSLTSSRHWRAAPVRFGCARSRAFIQQFPDKADHFARATIEAGSRPLSPKPTPNIKGGSQ